MAVRTVVAQLICDEHVIRGPSDLNSTSSRTKLALNMLWVELK